MERSLLACFLLLGLVYQSLVTPIVCRNLEGSVLNPDCDCPTPSHHGGGHGTPTPSHSSSGKPKPAPSTPTTPSNPSHPSPSSPSPPAIITPPSTPVTPTPTTPVIPTPSLPDPTTVPPFAPGSCSYWISHPGAIWAIFGYWGTVGKSFGPACGAIFGKNMSLQDAMKNTRTDGVGNLYREGTAALLNSLVCKRYSFTPQQVKDAFAAAVVSDRAAAAQAQIFKQANEGGVKH